MINRITGHAEVEIAGKVYTVRFTWAAIAEIQERFGDGPNMFNPDTVAGVAAIGFRNYHPELTAERIKELSPPLVPFAKAIQEALQWAYFGPDTPPSEGAEKKSQVPGGLLMRLKRLVGMG